MGPGGTPYIRMIGMIVVFLGVLLDDLVFSRGCSIEIYKNKTGILLGYKNFEVSWVQLLWLYVYLVFFRLIFDQGVCFRVRKFVWLGIFRVVFKDFRRSSLSFLPQSTPPPGVGHANRARTPVRHSSIKISALPGKGKKVATEIYRKHTIITTNNACALVKT